jgi:hypothetical protein
LERSLDESATDAIFAPYLEAESLQSDPDAGNVDVVGGDRAQVNVDVMRQEPPFSHNAEECAEVGETDDPLAGEKFLNDRDYVEAPGLDLRPLVGVDRLPPCRSVRGGLLTG